MMRDGYVPPEVDVIICMYKRLSKLPADTRAGIATFIIDESDTFCTPDHVIPMLSVQPKSVITATATHRGDGMDIMMEALAGITSVDLTLADKFQHAKETKGVKHMFTISKVCTDVTTVRRKSKMGGTDFGYLLEQVLTHEGRNAAIVNEVCLAVNAGKKVLVLSKRKKHVAHLLAAFTANGHTADYMAGEKKKYTDSQILLGTTSKIGRAFDEAMACQTFNGKCINFVVLTCTIKKLSAFVQAIGRGFRAEQSEILVFVDKDPIFHSHWRGTMPTVIAAGGKIMERKLDCTTGGTR